ncbi:hypothetical protein JCM14244_10960 [Venenivibrio stagnispumantis]|uniref:Beta-barrel porin-2, OmpL-like. bbp2 n=1 Tax=Venenivibrio stagnispumantis TaxID=407998 RepID=A0AA45WKL2_9AQUI|nr:porin [Venenivibrio stagnispumantis]MCW4572997.1 porin [Venenivibrio stagnispumantis]SMP07890.1 Putative beta-barrel porin-2, OmpL-like. bbp2 [Venenivibrio stagnispumantis]
MKKVVGLAAAGLLAVSAANAGQITVANTDLTLFGGVSTGYNLQNNDHLLNAYDVDGKLVRTPDFKKDSFSVNTFAVGLTKPAKNAGDIGVTAVFASFEVPTVIASSDVVNGKNTVGTQFVGHGDTTTFKPWLAYVTYMPVAGLSIDAGLLWQNFGEKPVTILNPHINRGILFTAQPVVMTGARATYDAGIVKVYAGAGKVDNQLMAPVYEALLPSYAKSYVEGGITGKINVMNYPIELGLHAYNESGGRDVYVASAGTDFGIVSLGLDINYFHADDNLKYVNGARFNESAWGTALCANVKPLANFQVPVRIEYVNNQDSLLVVPLAVSDARAAWSFTITPTYNPTKNTFIRAEFTYTKGTSTKEGAQDSYVFINSDGGLETSRTVGAVELGFLF